MQKNPSIRGLSGFKSHSTPRRDRPSTSTPSSSGVFHAAHKSSIEHLLTRTSFSIEDGTVSLRVEIPNEFQSEMLNAFADKLKVDFIKNLFEITMLPSNFRTPFLRKLRVREDESISAKAQRVPVTRAYSSNDIYRKQVLLNIPYVSERSHTKEAQLSIGITSPTRVYQFIEELANLRDESANKVACDFLARGLISLSEQLDIEDDEIVFTQFENKLSEFREGSSRRWMLRVDRRVYNRTSLLAEEFGRSLANVALLCVVHTLSNSESNRDFLRLVR